MKYFLKKILLFSLFLSFFFLLIMAFNIKNDYYGVIIGDMETQLMEPNQHYLKIKHLVKKPKKYNSYFFGSSRVGKIDTRNIKDGNSWYNLSYSEAIPSENLADLKLLLKNDVKINNIILGLDDISYLIAPETHLNDVLRKPYESYFTVFDYLIMKPSLSTIKANNNAKKEVYYDIYNSGFPIVLYKDKWINSNKDIHINDVKFTKPNWNPKYSDRIKKAISEISEIIKICENNNIKLILFINPMHSTTYLNLDLDKYLMFLNLLAKQKSFYDFSGVNRITTNNFNYYETSHYRPVVGELIKSVIFEQKQSDFFRFVTKKNIDSILKLKKKEFASKQKSFNKNIP